MILVPRSVFLVLTLCVVWAGAPRPARAGGGPENVAVVVNADSWASQAVANEFIHLRKVPARNVIYLAGVRDFERTTVEDFRKTILQPVLDAIEKRGLGDQIDYVVYSADLPTEIDITIDATNEALAKFPPPVQSTITKAGSINGLTFLHSLVTAKDLRYAALNANRYFRPVFRREGRIESQPATGFRSALAWGADGAIVPPEQGPRYLLSAVLAVTSGRGNSVREAIQCLQRAAAADGNQPAGTVYFCRNDDVRSRAREPLFAPAVEALAALGVRAEVIEGILPKNKKDVAGLMTGTSEFNWRSCGSVILPGAICEHFTSWGGVLREGASQSPLTDFIQYGAAGASGTVTEPLAVPQKFPTAFLHAYYARGCSLAEAFYQSVLAPYQLLIVGDPLCQPWARIPAVTAEIKAEGGAEVKPGGAVSGKLTIRPGVAQKDMEIGRYELFVDGLRKAGAPTGEAMELDTGALEQGWHELRVVAIAKEPPQTQGRVILPIVVSRGGPTLTFTPPKEPGVTWDSPLAVRAGLPGAKRIVFLHNGREVGAISGPQGEAKLDLRAIGQGRVLVQPVGVLGGKDGNESRVLGEPFALEIRPPMPLVPPAASAEGTLAKGVLVVTADGRKTVVDKVDMTKDAAGWLARCGLRKDQDFQIQACFAVSEIDTYQFQLRTNLALTIELDSRLLDAPKGGEWRFLPVSLATGTHRLLIKGKGAAGAQQLDLRFGGKGAKSIGNIFQHVRAAGEIAGGRP